MFKLTRICRDLNLAIYRSAEVQHLLTSNATFDVIIADAFGPEALFGIANHYNASVIAVSTVRTNPWIQTMTGTPIPTSFVRFPVTEISQDMRFFDRLKNAGAVLTMELLNQFFLDPFQEEAYNVMWSDPKPSYRDLKKEMVSLVLMNSHISLDGSQPLLTNIIEVGGMQVNTKLADLPEAYQNFMDSATDGVILFSLGSNLEASFIADEKRTAIVKVLSQRKEKVILKWDHPESIKHISKEKFLTTKWLPQSDLLAHKNLRLFITHGGLGGLTETIYHGKPTILIPIFGDQHSNAENARQFGIGLQLDYLNLTEASLSWALNEVLDNPTYTNRATELSVIYKDRPQDALELAKFWVEYVIRHKGARFLRSPATRLNYIQYYSFDVYGFMIAVLLLTLWIIKVVLTFTCRKIFCRQTKKHKKA